MTKYVVMFVLVLLAAGSAAQTIALPADLAGTYAATGTGVGGTYTATAEIIARDKVYEVRWTFSDGSVMYGVGLVRDGLFIVGFNPGPGVSIYRVVRDKPMTLEAQWALWGETQTYVERLTKGPPAIRAAR